MKSGIWNCASNNMMEKKKLQVLPLHVEEAHKISVAIIACI